MNRVTVCLVTGIVAAMTISRSSSALTLNWNNNAGGSYTTASNWTDSVNPANHVVPGAADAAVLNRNLNIQYNVAFPGRPIVTPLTREVHQLTLGTNSVSFADSVNINQLPAAFAIDSMNSLSKDALTIGDTSGQVAILNTTLNSFSTSSATIGNAAGATGTLNVNGGSFSVTNATPIFYPFSIGFSGNGTFNVIGGGHATATNVSIGNQSGSAGIANVSGPGSTWSTRTLYLGNGDAAGTMTVASGGSVSCADVTLGSGAISLTVTGTGSTLSGNLLENLNGHLMIQNAGHVTNSAGHIGVGGTAFVDVDGTGSTWTNNSELKIGYGGTGSVNIRNGGHATAGNTSVGEIRIDQFGAHPGQGAVSIDGADSNLSIGGSLYIGSFGGGTLAVNNGGTVSATGTLTIGFEGTISGNSTLIANVSNGGVVAPGISPTTPAAALHVTGNFVQFPGDTSFPAGTLQIELGGTMPGVDYDQLLATGSFTAAGTLSVSLINSFAPQAGDNFNILDFASQSGTFANVQLPNLGSSLGWNTSQLYTSGVLSVVSLGVPGDYNNNGTVDAGDYVLWRKYQGTTHVLPNDPTGGTIGTSQYTTWRAHFGQPPGSGSGMAAHTAVPEPTLLVLLLVAAVAIIGRLRLRST